MDNDIHRIYEAYINAKRISDGAKSLLKISKSSLDDFEFQYVNNDKFKNIIDAIILSEMRSDKIDNIFNESNRKYNI